MRNITFLTGTLQGVAHKNINGRSATIFILKNEDTLIKCKALGAVSTKAKEIFERDEVFTVIGSVTSKVVNGEINQTGIDVYHLSKGEKLTPDGEEDVLLSNIINAIYNVEEDEAPNEYTLLMESFYDHSNSNTKAYLRGRWGARQSKKGQNNEKHVI